MLMWMPLYMRNDMSMSQLANASLSILDATQLPMYQYIYLFCIFGSMILLTCVRIFFMWRLVLLLRKQQSLEILRLLFPNFFT